MTAPIFPDDGDELAAVSTTIRPIVDAGKGRALALKIVRVTLLSFIQPSNSPWLAAGIAALSQWFARALDIDTGRENEPPPPCEDCGARASCKHRHIRPPYTLLDVAGIAERIASMARHTPMFQPMGQERLIVYDLATALRRACECSNRRALNVVDIEDVTHIRNKAKDHPQTGEYDELANAYERENEAHREWNERTAAVLLPLLIRDLRRLCTSARVDPAPIEAAIARHEGTPS